MRILTWITNSFTWLCLLAQSHCLWELIQLSEKSLQIGCSIVTYYLRVSYVYSVPTLVGEAEAKGELIDAGLSESVLRMIDVIVLIFGQALT